MSSLPPDPYKILGVSKDAQPQEIRSAHRKLVLKCHPDKVQDPKLKEEKQKEFQQVQQAYELLINEAERARYDDKVRLEELRKDRGMTSTSSSSPRTSKRHDTKYHFDVREAEPRPSSFGSSTPHNVYGHTPPSRSFDDDIFNKKFEEKVRQARKTQSYEKAKSYEFEREKPSKKDEERRKREEEKEWIREKEREKERAKEREQERQRELKEREREREREKDREREMAKKEKDRRKEDKKKAEKDRRKESDEKHRRHGKSPYIEVCPDTTTDDDEVVYSSSSKDKKKSSSSRKYEEAPPAAAEPPPPPPTTERERKNSEVLESAYRYLSRSGGNVPTMSRAKTYHGGPEFNVRHIAPIAVPTPPPAAAGAFKPPPMADSRETPVEEEEAVKRSSGRPRRMSHENSRSSKEKSSHKKSGSPREPMVAETPTPGARIVPSFQKSQSIPIPHLQRSNTEGYSRPPAAGLERSTTWIPDSSGGRERSRPRHAAHVYMADDESEDDRDRRHRRGRRTASPDVMPTQSTSTKRYQIDPSNVKVIPVGMSEEPPRSSKKPYPIPNSSARRSNPRTGYYTDEYEDNSGAYFPAGYDIKFAPTFDANEIKYSKLPHPGVTHAYREELPTR
ncbi:hypothetical protein M426DRAFT_24564 [Hypoxylon sp. CI-4A]|nr:hypothetical protein M426DRAFT_24564 [Hypoxylon sp. CI-4A]